MGGTRLPFAPLDREMRLSDRVADEILRAIVDRDHVWEPGDRLPSETALAEQFGVSRTVIREAMRTLAGKGVVDRRRGRGGTRVSAVTESALRDSMSLFLRSRARWHYPEVHEMRAMFEAEAASLAASRASDDEIRRMADVCVQMDEALDDMPRASRLDLEFHQLVVRATKNVLYGVMLDAVSDALLEIRLDTFGPHGRARAALESHQAILQRIREHDAPGARAAMAQHLDDVAQFWQAAYGPPPAQREASVQVPELAADANSRGGTGAATSRDPRQARDRPPDEVADDPPSGP